MLSGLELKVVHASKIPGFGAYLQVAWLQYPLLNMEIVKGKYPTKERLQNLNEEMRLNKYHFDIEYFHSLAEQSVNPLKTEQEAWSLLSSIIEGYLNNFVVYLQSYSPREMTEGKKKQLIDHINRGWELIQKWNIISRSFKAKQEEMYDELEEREGATKQLILELSSEAPNSKN